MLYSMYILRKQQAPLVSFGMVEIEAPDLVKAREFALQYAKNQAANINWVDVSKAVGRNHPEEYEVLD